MTTRCPYNALPYVHLGRMEVLTVGGKQKVCCILLRQPFDLVDLLLDLQTLQVVKLRLVTLECAVNIVLPSTMGLCFTLLKKKWKQVG